MSKPRRRIDITIKIGADDPEALFRALDQMYEDLVELTEFNKVEILQAAPDYGYSARGDEDISVTHESYMDSLQAFLRGERPLS